jgi:hypothetical protein
MKTIVWDNDDTINNFRLDWFNSLDNNLSYPEVFSVRKPHEILKLTKSELTKSMIGFKKENFKDITISNNIINWFNIYGDCYNHIVLTSLSREVFHESIWSSIYFLGRWLHSYNFVTLNKDSDINEFITKGEFIVRHLKDIDIFIDDNEENCKEINRLGIQSFCVKQPWNEGLGMDTILKKLVELI